MARRRNAVSDFFDGFNQTYSTVNKVMQDYELAEIANAKAVTSKEFTEEQGADLEAAAKSGQYDIGVKTKDDGTFDSYTVTPKADPSQTGVIAAQRGVTDFLGKRTAGEMTADQQDNARLRAMAGVIKKYGDPMGGLRLEQQARQGEREDQRFQWEQKRANREEESANREDEWRKGRDGLFQNSHFGQIQRANSEAKSKYESDLAEYNRRLQAGEQGLTAPVQPELKAYGYGQSLLDHLSLAAHDVQYGKAGAETLSKLAKMQQEFTDEGYAKALKLAQGGAPIAEVAKVFNASGKIQLDPSALVSDRMVDMGNGLQTRVLTFKGANGNNVTINTFSELDALDKADKLVDRVFKTNADTRDSKRLDETIRHNKASEGVAAAGLEDKRQDRADAKSKAEAAVKLHKERNPNATDAELEAVRRGVLEAVPSNKGYKVEMGDVASALGTPAVDPDGKPVTDLMTGRQVVNRNVEKEQAFFKWMRDNNIKDTNQGLALYLGQGGAGAAKPRDQNDAHAQAQAALGRGASKEAVNARLKQMGYAPLP